MNEQPHSVYKLGAEDGLVMGPLLATTVIMVGASTFVPVFFWFTLALMIMVPIVCFRLLKRSYLAYTAESTFSALWLEGICMFFFGGLIMAAVVYVALRWVWPTFIFDMATMAVDIYSDSTSADAKQVADVLKDLIKKGGLPSPIDIALELIYAVVFSGSLLSMLLSGIVRYIGGRPAKITKSDNNPQ